MKLSSLQPKISQLNTLVASAPPQAVRLRGEQLQKRNERLLALTPLCVECLKHGQFHEAKELDHIVPLWKGGPDDESNLQGLCLTCHKAKTASEAEERGGYAP